jgi:ribosomal protein S18 acetylase RimI-like enzyme
MDKNVIIRAYSLKDKSRLVEIWRSASEKGHPFFTREQLNQQQKLVSDIYLPNAENHVAIVNDKAVGFIGLLDHHIGGLFVDPAQHGSGIGRKLVDHAFESRAMLELEVYSMNTRAVGFYRHLGFDEISRRPTDDNGLPFELIKLRLTGK